jgi:hypothetical protein
MGTAGVAVANAPVSYGAFELTVGHDPNVPSGVSVLDQVAEAGYAGIDLGPVGYLGHGGQLGEALAARGLGLAGAYLELSYADADALSQALPGLDALLDTFDAVQPYLTGPPPRPTWPTAAARRGGPPRGGRSPTRPRAWTQARGTGSAPGWPGWSAAAATVATSRPSIPRPAPTWKRGGRSSGCWNCPISGSAWRPAT